MRSLDETQPINQKGREDMRQWQKAITQNPYEIDPEFQHCIQYYLSSSCPNLSHELHAFAERIIKELEPLVIENNLAANLPRLESYNGIGERIDTIIHHPSYIAAGDIIYSSALLARMAEPGRLLEALTFLFFSSQAGEAGHNCPIACSAGIIRVLKKMADFPQKDFYLKKLTESSFTANFTGAQFLTEVQGGSDVGLNATVAYQDKQQWRIRGEKWFCSNANADLILLTARYDQSISGTKGLGLFLVPTFLANGTHNDFTIRRLKDKIGTQSMASGEIDFHGAIAYAIDKPENGFKIVMENVLHLSRLFNTFCMLGMARKAYFIANQYTHHRVAFGQPIFDYPLIKENLATIKTENTAMLAAIFATVQLQDQYDLDQNTDEEMKLLLRLLANLNKYLSALWSVEHIHHAIDMLAGNGAIESFSILPRLLRDSIVCENWEGTHNTLRMQILKDIQRYRIDQIFLHYVKREMTSINAEDKYTRAIDNFITKLSNNLEQLQQANDALKTLQIKNIVDQMTYLFCAVHLLKEGLHQKQQNNHNTKLLCLDYFILLHLTENKIAYNNDFLDLISKIVS